VSLAATNEILIRPFFGFPVNRGIKIKLYRSMYVRLEKLAFYFCRKQPAIAFLCSFSKRRWLSQPRLSQYRHFQTAIRRWRVDSSQRCPDSPSWRAHVGLMDRHSLYRDAAREILQADLGQLSVMWQGSLVRRKHQQFLQRVDISLDTSSIDCMQTCRVVISGGITRFILL